jgi:peptidyl-prolyl cis-trans isomerase A (cyclophilin A)
MKKASAILIIVIIALALCGQSLFCDGLYAEFHTTKGQFVIELEYEKVPVTVANFIGLAEGTIKNNETSPGDPFYAGKTMHINPGKFVHFGYVRNAKWLGYDFPDEFHPDLKHDEAGIVSMYNTLHHSNSSIVCIDLKPMPENDEKFPVFGKVIEGMDVVRKIVNLDKIEQIKIIRVGESADSFSSTQRTFENLVQSRLAQLTREQKERALKEMKKAAARWPGLKSTPSGLMYKILEPGTGKKLEDGMTVNAEYVIRLINDEVVGGEKGKPSKVMVGNRFMIKGWAEALPDMRVGERRLLVIPPHLSYGHKGLRPMGIYPGAVLIFDIKILEILEEKKK